MKQLLSILLVVCLMLGLVACGKEEVPEKNPPVTTQNDATPDPEPDPNPENDPATETETEPEPEPEPAFRHPLNGAPLEEAWTGRPTTAVLGNTKDALPQCGINDAAIIYEAETEGGTTRMLAVYGDVANLPCVGPIRSARTFFNNLSVSYDAVILHCGGSVRGRNGYHDISGTKIPDWDHVDARYHDAGAEKYQDTMFYRDEERNNSGYNFEHTLFIQGNAITHLLTKNQCRTTTEEGWSSGLQFKGNVALTGKAATNVTVNFAAYKTTTFVYNAETGLYKASQYKQDWVDGNTSEVTQFKNLIVLSATQQTRSDGEYPRSYYELVGTGTGSLVIDGQMASIKWSREALESPFIYTYEDGTPVILEPGRTYIAITSDPEPITCK